MITLDTPLSALPSIKRPMLPRLARLGLTTMGDLLRHFPSRYEDYSTIVSIGDARPDEKATFEGTLRTFENRPIPRRKLQVTTATVADDTGEIRAVWFNQKFLAQSVRVGMTVSVSGTPVTDRGTLVLKSPAIEAARRDPTHTARLVPVYPETHGVTSKFLRWQIELLFKRRIAVADPIPDDILAKLNLPSLAHAFRMIHAPRSEDEYQVARKRFAFDEIFLIQLKALQVRFAWDTERSIAFPSDKEHIERFLSTLSFRLTDSQTNAIAAIQSDLAKPQPMNRLLNGDVGSGKTIVAATTLLSVANAGFQTVFLAPTEVLARQHFESLHHTLGHEPFDIALLTASYRILGHETVRRETILRAIQDGIPRVIVATHAVLQKDLRFHNLAFVIVDEQHRFGVAQRAYLQQSAARINDGLPDVIPHFLTMTATPIPRTLALAFFGNLDVSLLTEMPRNRKPIKTRIATNQADRKIVYDFIRKEVGTGRQAFVILPLVEESEALTEVKAAVAEHERLARDIFPDLRVGLLHGKMKAKEKESVMADFKDRKYDVLVATAVVEVGIDIPNASIILIEEADRFGLAQLHQFRGRVGRGEHQSYCFLFPGESGSVDNARLKALEKTTSGFELAEIDLKLRGAGSLFGARQSGMSDIAMANIANVRLVEIARAEAQALLESDPALTAHPLLAESLRRFDERIHLE